MFGNLLSTMTMTPVNNTTEGVLNRRRHTRRYSDQCVCEIDGKTYPILNWSIGGVQITADDRMFGTDQSRDVKMKFKVRGAIETVEHTAKVVRKSTGRVAFQFEPLTRQVRNQFQNILDDYAASEFADSQV